VVAMVVPEFNELILVGEAFRLYPKLLLEMQLSAMRQAATVNL
jgi:hypothetical protein